MIDEIETEKNKNYENGISFIIPCKNEEKYIKDTVIEISKSVTDTIDYEILIINDFSEDQTENIAKELALNNTKIKFINNNIHLGFGGSFIKALKFVKKEFIYLIPGDNAVPSDVIKKMLININDFDLIFGIPVEIKKDRQIHRKFFSKLFTIIVNIFFGQKLKYYNGIGIIRTKVINSLNIKSNSPVFQAEIVLKILKLKLRYDQRSIIFIERKFGKSAIFNFNTIFRSVFDLLKIRLNY